jgi:hypothetical protein
VFHALLGTLVIIELGCEICHAMNLHSSPQGGIRASDGSNEHPAPLSLCAQASISMISCVSTTKSLDKPCQTMAVHIDISFLVSPTHASQNAARQHILVRPLMTSSSQVRHDHPWNSALASDFVVRSVVVRLQFRIPWLQSALAPRCEFSLG